MTQLLLEDIDADLNDRIREFAEREGLTRRQAALCLLRKGAGLPEQPANGAGGKKGKRDPALARLVGSMTAAEADEINAAIEEMFENIDEEKWR